jgi:hypothetical protein
MSFPSTLVIHGYGTVLGSVEVLMEDFVILTPTQVHLLHHLFTWDIILFQFYIVAW